MLLEHLSQLDDQLTDQHITNQILLQPLEIALKTRRISNKQQTQWRGRSQYNRQQQRRQMRDKQIGGLYMVNKNTIQQNRFNLINFNSYKGADESQSNLSSLRQRRQNNLISFLKPRLDDNNNMILDDNRQNLSICICMYNQQKNMLKNTLKGVQQNIINIIKDGIQCDQITVVVIIDGIQKMNKDMISFFEEYQRSNHLYIEEQTNIDIHDLINNHNTRDNEDSLNTLNLNMVLFDQLHLQQRKKRKFKNVYNRYMQILQLQMSIKQMHKNLPNYNSLPILIKDIFMKVAKQQYFNFNLKFYQFNLDEIVTRSSIQRVKNNMKRDQKVQQQQILRFAFNNQSIYHSLMAKALKQAQKQCQQFLNNKQNLSYLVSYRKKITLNGQQLNEDRQQLYQQRLLKQSYINMFICVKYKNGGKLSSHNWFFNGFCKELYPKYTILLDVGLRPHSLALYKMYKYLKNNNEVGGVCGYMNLKPQPLTPQDQIKQSNIDFVSSLLLNIVDIQLAQQIEYHISHLIDKAFESQFDFIHVLPGAFSAYNMNILTKSDKNGNTLLKQYFKSIDDKLINNKIIDTKITSIDIILRIILPDFIYRFLYQIDSNSQQIMLEMQNVYLAQDRILCLGIYQNNSKMHFLPDAFAEVDPAKTLQDILGQRKRWINGSMFAFNKVNKQINKSCIISFQMNYLSFLNLLSFLSPAIFLFTIHLAMQAFRVDVLPFIIQGSQNGSLFDFFVYTVDFIYVLLIGGIIILSLHFKSDNLSFKPYIYGISTTFGLFQLGIFILLIVDLMRSIGSSKQAFLQNNVGMKQQLPGGQSIINAFRLLVVSNLLIFIIPIILFVGLYGRGRILCDMIRGIISSIFYAPTFLIILNIYALCRIDDLSWGTKGLDKQIQYKYNNLQSSWKQIKFIKVFKYIFWNIIIGCIFISFGENYDGRFYISLIVIIIIQCVLLIKIFIGCIYLISYRCRNGNDNIPQNMNLVRISRIFQELSVLRREVLLEMQKSLEKLVKQNTQVQSLSFMFNPFTVSRINFMKKLNINGSRIMSKRPQKRQKKLINNLLTISEQRQYRTPSKNKKLQDSYNRLDSDEKTQIF